MIHWNEIAAHIAAATGEPFQAREPRPVAGGCINESVVLCDGTRCFFVKLNRAERQGMFAAESEGLALIASTGTIRVPAPVCAGVTNGHAYLVMERLDLGGRARDAEAGRRLAAMHHCTASAFGWHRDNTIGSTAQHNAPSADWTRFWREQRLGFQLELAAANGYGPALQPGGDRLLASLDALLDHSPAPSLLHGDLWGGNIAYTRAGEPVIFDPAVYYGDREADLAMTELFGGFGSAFYVAYREAWPLDPGYATRKTLYNLYHVLNHLNLFGGGYAAQARDMIERLLATVGRGGPRG